MSRGLSDISTGIQGPNGFSALSESDILARDKRSCSLDPMPSLPGLGCTVIQICNPL